MKITWCTICLFFKFYLNVYRVGGTLADHVKFDASDDENAGWGHCTCENHEKPSKEDCYFPEVGHGGPGRAQKILIFYFSDWSILNFE